LEKVGIADAQQFIEDNPLIHSSPHFREPIKRSLIKTKTYQNYDYLCHSGNPTWRIMSQTFVILYQKKCKQMAEFDDFNFDTSSDEGEFEGFTPDDVIKVIEKGAQLRQINDGELSDISFDRSLYSFPDNFLYCSTLFPEGKWLLQHIREWVFLKK
jgi:hypothetical protein